eukprot:4738496-Alexandrium_andersonii.AAC.1
MKCSKEKLYRRLRAFWANVLRARWLWHFVRGGAGPEWLNADQKPLWFTSNAAAKTLAPRGSRSVR